MQRLNKNHGGYFGETVELKRFRRDLAVAAKHHGWHSELFCRTTEFELLALRRLLPAAGSAIFPRRIYISAGIHGDEPAGPMAVLRLVQENRWPANAEIILVPCLNPTGLYRNRRENGRGIDLNRDYRDGNSPEVRAHIAWLKRQPRFDLCLCLHEDWEAHGFYVYELNPDHKPSLAEAMVAAVAGICPLDLSPIIEGRAAKGGIIRPDLDPRSRPQWPEAFWLLTHKTRLSYTLEAPSDFPLPVRVNALVAGVQAALACGLLSNG